MNFRSFCSVAHTCILNATVLAFSSLPVAGQTFTMLHTQSGNQDGSPQQSYLLLGESGNLYGTTTSGGASGYGTVFMLDSLRSETVLYEFPGLTSFGIPHGILVRHAGHTYGIVQNGGEPGCQNFDCGAVFDLIGGRARIVHKFSPSEAYHPTGSLVKDASGNLYGTTWDGGSVNHGTIYEISGGEERILYNFDGPADGVTPGFLTIDPSGNLYGVTSFGGSFGHGTVFELSTNENGAWSEQILYSFRGKTDGGVPSGAPIFDGKGNLYGVTPQGGRNDVGTCRVNGCGVAYKLARNSEGIWSERVLYTFEATAEDARQPFPTLVRDKQGTLYGVSIYGGTNLYGTVYKIDHSGVETILHNFTGHFGHLGDGGQPLSGLTIDASGNLYGTSSNGVFKIAPQ